MNKLVLTVLLSVVTVNAFSMEYDPDAAAIKAIFYPIAGATALGAMGYFGSQMWQNYLLYGQKTNKGSNEPNSATQSNWAPYAKIAAGLGLTGLTAYLGMKQPAQANSMIAQYDVNSVCGGVGPTLSPQIMIPLGSLYTLAPMVPAYFFLKSGFDDLKRS